MKKLLIVSALIASVVAFTYYKYPAKTKIQQPAPEKETPFVPKPIDERIPLFEEVDEKKELLPSKNVKTYEEAVKAAKAHKMPIFLYFGAEWCGPCKTMKATTLADEEVKTKLQDYIVLFVDVDKEKALTKKFKVNGIPSYMVIASDETILARTSGGKNKQEFLDWLKPKNVSLIEE